MNQRQQNLETSNLLLALKVMCCLCHFGIDLHTTGSNGKLSEKPRIVIFNCDF